MDLSFIKTSGAQRRSRLIEPFTDRRGSRDPSREPEAVWGGWHPVTQGDAMPYAINDAGQVVGSLNGRAFLYDQGTFTDLGGIGEPQWTLRVGAAINNQGLIAGWTRPAGGFLLTLPGTLVILSKTLKSVAPYAINDKAEIVGQATTEEGYFFAFYWSVSSGMGVSGVSIDPNLPSYLARFSSNAWTTRFMCPGLMTILETTVPEGGASMIKSRINSSRVWATTILLE